MADLDSLWEIAKTIWLYFCLSDVKPIYVEVAEEDFCLGVIWDIAKFNGRVWRLGFLSGSACN